MRKVYINTLLFQRYLFSIVLCFTLFSVCFTVISSSPPIAPCSHEDSYDILISKAEQLMFEPMNELQQMDNTVSSSLSQSSTAHDLQRTEKLQIAISIAHRCITKAVKKRPYSSKPWLMLAAIAKMAELYPQAITYYQNAIERLPTDQTIDKMQYELELSWLFEQVEQYGRCIQMNEQIIEQNTDQIQLQLDQKYGTTTVKTTIEQQKANEKRKQKKQAIRKQNREQNEEMQKKEEIQEKKQKQQTKQSKILSFPMPNLQNETTNSSLLQLYDIRLKAYRYLSECYIHKERYKKAIEILNTTWKMINGKGDHDFTHVIKLTILHITL